MLMVSVYDKQWTRSWLIPGSKFTLMFGATTDALNLSPAESDIFNGAASGNLGKHRIGLFNLLLYCNDFLSIGPQAFIFLSKDIALVNTLRAGSWRC